MTPFSALLLPPASVAEGARWRPRPGVSVRTPPDVPCVCHMKSNFGSGSLNSRPPVVTAMVTTAVQQIPPQAASSDELRSVGLVHVTAQERAATRQIESDLAVIRELQQKGRRRYVNRKLFICMLNECLRRVRSAHAVSGAYGRDVKNSIS
ncbi:hypothetical protein EVAR_98388_1 [Eumeta japonica]|uniref:Uncharacterized protein n=1 Tax=Eumeta variegata TaxID=151549 RepID=A0A4C1XU27_EUMVA|nr:hypothetical protein EVAR_98388_1 [Eumeta japonica]